MKKYILLLSAVLLVASVSFASDNMGARPMGMGGAFVAIADDANAIFENPAGIGYLHGEHAVVSNKISDRSYTIIGGVEETPVGNFGIGYISSAYPIDGLSAAAINDQGEAPVAAQNQALILSYAREFNRFSVVPKFMGKLSLGGSLKVSNYLITRAKGLSDNNGSIINADLAAMLKPGEDISLGINIKNFFSAMDSASEDEYSISLGASAKLLESIIVSADSDGRVGCEWKPISLVALRAGKDGVYNTAGVGVSRNGVGVNYAYRGSESPIHYISISLAFDKQPDRRVAEINKI
ncbi:MAG: hypothetical protein U9R38_02430 [Candidatus Margulisiibacteriota bacterium]|nr:hypothetical protein [Candidatus Margulisiibacteriota bacterium]